MSTKIKPKELKLSGIQRLWLNQEFDGTELCGECNLESDFSINPMKKTRFKCQECGEEILPCSLCDSCGLCGVSEGKNDCQYEICASLLAYNGMWDEEINGKYPGSDYALHYSDDLD